MSGDDSRLAAVALNAIRCHTGGVFDAKNFHLADALESGAKVILPKEALAVIEGARLFHDMGARHDCDLTKDTMCFRLAAYDKAVA